MLSSALSQLEIQIQTKIFVFFKQRCFSENLSKKTCTLNTNMLFFQQKQCFFEKSMTKTHNFFMAKTATQEIFRKLVNVSLGKNN